MTRDEELYNTPRLTLIARIKELEARLYSTYCAYCGHEEPLDDDESRITSHIRTCDKHPMRAAEQRVVKVEETMRAIIDAADECGAPWVAPGIRAAINEGREILEKT